MPERTKQQYILPFHAYGLLDGMRVCRFIIEAKTHAAAAKLKGADNDSVVYGYVNERYWDGI